MVIYIKLFFTAVFWGGTFIAGRVVAREVGPFAAAFLRFAIATTLLMVFTSTRNGGFPIPKKHHILPLLLLGATGIFSYNVFFFKGLQTVEAGRAALIIANNPVFIAIFSALLFGEKLSPLKLVGVLISVSGAVVVISRGEFAHLFDQALGLGELYIFFCVLSWVAYSLIGKAILVGLSPLVSVSYSCLVGTFFLFVPAYREGLFNAMAGYSPLAWLCIVYLGVCGTVLGFVWYYEGIKAIGPTKASQFINFVPISAVILAFFMLGEMITASLLIGTVLVCSGVYLTNKPKG